MDDKNTLRIRNSTNDFLVFATPETSVRAHEKGYALRGAPDDEYTEIGTLTAAETAGIGHKWANPELVPLETSAWAQATVEKEFRK